MLGSIHAAVTTPGRNPRVVPLELKELSADEKKQIVMRDPKWGMCSMMNYMILHGGNKECSHVFGRQFCLPIVIFIAQWLMFIGIVIHNLHQPMKCGSKTIENKFLVVSVSLVYFVNSFFLYDDIRDRSRQVKVACSSSYITMIDAFQEHAFNLFVNVANLWIVFITPDFLDCLFNSLALEFVMNLDNGYESLYFKYSLNDAVDIYDNFFVTQDESRRNVKNRLDTSFMFKLCRYVTFIPFKLLGWGFIVLPVYCIVMGIFAATCE